EVRVCVSPRRIDGRVPCLIRHREELRERDAVVERQRHPRVDLHCRWLRTEFVKCTSENAAGAEDDLRMKLEDAGVDGQPGEQRLAGWRRVPSCSAVGRNRVVDSLIALADV